MRYERKFPSQYLSFSALEQLVLLHPLGFRKIFPDRRVNNIYFDTAGWQTFYENLAGVSCRTKYRLRWYGQERQRLAGAGFELKKKENLLGTKINYELPEKINWADIPAILHEIPALREKALMPTLVNSYKRAYYQSADDKFRLTLDRHLRCGPYLHQELALRAFPEELLVAELKYAAEDDALLDTFTQYWPLRSDRFSKYVSGMQLIYGG